ncbi:SHOCT domain-containing protein [Halorussus salinus]|uniref:SHOCT domain-containing protein n=1 Tax=Halorussus salinus TaxID=1364935 RepID=UPI001092B139|nr:SHOCT domain-containing protein [Halorussus salinus]
MNQSPDTSASTSTFRALHRLVEHYTPDGTIGRTLLGGTALFLAPVLFLGGSSVLFGGAFLPIVLFALASVVLSVPTLFVGLVTLWPVYLSLIGNVESPELYPDGASAPETDGERESAEAILKRRYAAGELSREEFERQLNAVLRTSSSDGRDGLTGDGRGRDDERREPARNR